MTFGNRFWPRNRRQVFDADITSLNTVRRALSCDNAPFMRTVRCLTFANPLSIGFEVRKMIPMVGGKVEERQQGRRSLIRHSTALWYLGAYFSANAVIAASAAALFGDSQISRRSLCALDCIDFGSLSSTLSVFSSQHR